MTFLKGRVFLGSGGGIWTHIPDGLSLLGDPHARATKRPAEGLIWY